MYKRTELGHQEILQRNLKLSTRIRTLLLLIETQEVYKLDHKILNEVHLQQLLELKLIEHKDQKQESVIDDTNREDDLSVQQIEVRENSEANEPYIETQPQVSFATLEINDIKNLMKDTLQTYSGLISKQLIASIENAQTVMELKRYQKKWLTNLFETKICKKKLNQLLQQINHSMQRFDS